MSEDESPRSDPHSSVAAALLPWQRKSRFSWTPAFETTFFRSLCESVHLGLRDNMTFKPEAWDRALAALREQGAYPTKSHLVNKTDNARKRFRLWRGLIENPLFTYDEATRSVSASEEAWQAHIETEPLARVLRDRPFDNAEYLEVLFPDVVGSGGQPKRVTRLRRKGPDSLPDAEAPPGASIMHVSGDTRTQTSQQQQLQQQQQQQQQALGGTPTSAGRAMAHARSSMSGGGGVGSVPLRSNAGAGQAGMAAAAGFPGSAPSPLGSTATTSLNGGGPIQPPPPPSASSAIRAGGGILHGSTARGVAAGSALTPPEELTNGGVGATQKRQHGDAAAGSSAASAKRRRTDSMNLHGGSNGRNSVHASAAAANVNAVAAAAAAAGLRAGGSGAGAGANTAGLGVGGGAGGGAGGSGTGGGGAFAGGMHSGAGMSGAGAGVGTGGPGLGPGPGSGPGAAMTAVSMALARLDGVASMLSDVLGKCAEAAMNAPTASTTHWPEQAFALFFQEFADEDMDLQVRIAEKILTDTNKAVMFCKMPAALRKHWVKRLREASSRLGN